MSDQPIRRLRRSHPAGGKDIATRTHNGSRDTLDRMQPVFADPYAACEVWGRRRPCHSRRPNRKLVVILDTLAITRLDASPPLA